MNKNINIKNIDLSSDESISLEPLNRIKTQNNNLKGNIYKKYSLDFNHFKKKDDYSKVNKNKKLYHLNNSNLIDNDSTSKINSNNFIVNKYLRLNSYCNNLNQYNSNCANRNFSNNIENTTNFTSDNKLENNILFRKQNLNIYKSDVLYSYVKFDVDIFINRVIDMFKKYQIDNIIEYVNCIIKSYMLKNNSIDYFSINNYFKISQYKKKKFFEILFKIIIIHINKIELYNDAYILIKIFSKLNILNETNELFYNCTEKALTIIDNIYKQIENDHPKLIKLKNLNANAAKQDTSKFINSKISNSNLFFNKYNNTTNNSNLNYNYRINKNSIYNKPEEPILYNSETITRNKRNNSRNFIKVERKILSPVKQNSPRHKSDTSNKCKNAYLEKIFFNLLKNSYFIGNINNKSNKFSSQLNKKLIRNLNSKKTSKKNTFMLYACSEYDSLIRENYSIKVNLINIEAVMHYNEYSYLKKLYFRDNDNNTINYKYYKRLTSININTNCNTKYNNAKNSIITALDLLNKYKFCLDKLDFYDKIDEVFIKAILINNYIIINNNIKTYNTLINEIRISMLSLYVYKHIFLGEEHNNTISSYDDKCYFTSQCILNYTSYMINKYYNYINTYKDYVINENNKFKRNIENEYLINRKKPLYFNVLKEKDESFSLDNTIKDFNISNINNNTSNIFRYSSIYNLSSDQSCEMSYYDPFYEKALYKIERNIKKKASVFTSKNKTPTLKKKTQISFINKLTLNDNIKNNNFSFLQNTTLYDSKKFEYISYKDYCSIEITPSEDEKDVVKILKYVNYLLLLGYEFTYTTLNNYKCLINRYNFCISLLDCKEETITKQNYYNNSNILKDTENNVNIKNNSLHESFKHVNIRRKLGKISTDNSNLKNLSRYYIYFNNMLMFHPAICINKTLTKLKLKFCIEKIRKFVKDQDFNNNVYMDPNSINKLNLSSINNFSNYYASNQNNIIIKGSKTTITSKFQSNNNFSFFIERNLKGESNISSGCLIRPKYRIIIKAFKNTIMNRENFDTKNNISRFYHYILNIVLNYIKSNLKFNACNYYVEDSSYFNLKKAPINYNLQDKWIEFDKLLRELNNIDKTYNSNKVNVNLNNQNNFDNKQRNSMHNYLLKKKFNIDISKSTKNRNLRQESVNYTDKSQNLHNTLSISNPNLVIFRSTNDNYNIEDSYFVTLSYYIRNNFSIYISGKLIEKIDNNLLLITKQLSDIDKTLNILKSNSNVNSPKINKFNIMDLKKNILGYEIVPLILKYNDFKSKANHCSLFLSTPSFFNLHSLLCLKDYIKKVLVKHTYINIEDNCVQVKSYPIGLFRDYSIEFIKHRFLIDVLIHYKNHCNFIFFSKEMSSFYIDLFFDNDAFNKTFSNLRKNIDYLIYYLNNTQITNVKSFNSDNKNKERKNIINEESDNISNKEKTNRLLLNELSLINTECYRMFKDKFNLIIDLLGKLEIKVWESYIFNFVNSNLHKYYSYDICNNINNNNVLSDFSNKEFNLKPNQMFKIIQSNYYFKINITKNSLKPDFWFICILPKGFVNNIMLNDSIIQIQYSSLKEVSMIDGDIFVQKALNLKSNYSYKKLGFRIENVYDYISLKDKHAIMYVLLNSIKLKDVIFKSNIILIKKIVNNKFLYI